jgi:pyrimidine operon attenuation protein/uracil phosphoribosyltransferase
MSKVLMTAQEMGRTLERLACQVLELVDPAVLVLVGVQRRGVDLAARLARIIEGKIGKPVPCGELDINLYRDDWTTATTAPHINATHIDFSIEEKVVVLVDDVLFTGRTIRAALEALLDFGRPKAVKLLVLVDRGHRELPIHADWVGKRLDTSRREQVNVLLAERDGQDCVLLELAP